MLADRLASLLLVAVAGATSAQTPSQEIGPNAVAEPAAVKTCAAAGDSATARSCLADTLRKRQPEAARFAERLHGEGYLHAFSENGRVDVAYVTYMFRGNASSGVLLVNGTPSIVDVNDPASYKDIDIKKDPRYPTLAKKDGAIELWADDPGRPFADNLPDGGTRFRFNLPLKTCRACSSPGVAVVAFEFDSSGKFLGVRLLELQAGNGAPFQS